MLILPQVHGEKTICTSLTIVEEITVITAATIARKEEVVALLAVRKFIASFRLVAVQSIETFPGLDDLRTIETVLIVFCCEDEVTILIISGEVYIGGVLVAHDMQSNTRHLFLEFAQLLKEGASKIH